MRIASLAVALGCVIALAGCAPEPPPVTLPPSPTATPIFASEDEALAAAEEAYAAYRKAADQVGESGWQDFTPLEPLVTAEQLEDERIAAAPLIDRSLRQVGASSFDTARLQQLTDDEHGSVAMTVYVCADVSDTRVIDAEGNDVTPADRDARLPLEVDFVASEDGNLQVSRSELWSGASFC